MFNNFRKPSKPDIAALIEKKYRSDGCLVDKIESDKTFIPIYTDSLLARVRRERGLEIGSTEDTIICGLLLRFLAVRTIFFKGEDFWTGLITEDDIVERFRLPITFAEIYLSFDEYAINFLQEIGIAKGYLKVKFKLSDGKDYSINVVFNDSVTDYTIGDRKYQLAVEYEKLTGIVREVYKKPRPLGLFDSITIAKRALVNSNRLAPAIIKTHYGKIHTNSDGVEKFYSEGILNEYLVNSDYEPDNEDYKNFRDDSFELAVIRGVKNG